MTRPRDAAAGTRDDYLERLSESRRDDWQRHREAVAGECVEALVAAYKKAGQEINSLVRDEDGNGWTVLYGDDYKESRTYSTFSEMLRGELARVAAAQMDKKP